MATEAEIRETVDLLRSAGAGFALLHCQSTYPAPFKDVNLRYLDRLAEHRRSARWATPATSAASTCRSRPWPLGAKIIEKHFTTDRDARGQRPQGEPAARASSREMVQRVREVEDVAGQRRGPGRSPPAR